MDKKTPFVLYFYCQLSRSLCNPDPPAPLGKFLGTQESPGICKRFAAKLFGETHFPNGKKNTRLHFIFTGNSLARFAIQIPRPPWGNSSGLGVPRIFYKCRRKGCWWIYFPKWIKNTLFGFFCILFTGNSLARFAIKIHSAPLGKFPGTRSPQNFETCRRKSCWWIYFPNG